MSGYAQAWLFERGDTVRLLPDHATGVGRRYQLSQQYADPTVYLPLRLFRSLLRGASL